MTKNKLLRGVAVYMAFSLLFEICCPTVALALTGGPAQPETSSFEPIGTSEMVDLFSGDYNYNIPLLDVGGYPVNISYHSGISMDQEASWTGLGWNINPGAINRNMRGLPDDFKGDKVTKEFNVKANRTYGANIGFGAAVAGFDNISLNFSIGAKFNNYTGVGFEQSANIAISAGESGKGSGTASLGLHTSADGLDISPSVSFSATAESKDGTDTKIGGSIGSSFNSRSGLKALSIGVSMEQGRKADVKAKDPAKHKNSSAKRDSKSFASSSGSVGTGSSVTFTNPTYVPQINMPMKNLSVNANFQLGVTVFSVDGTLNVSGYYSEQKLAEKKQEIPAYGYLFSEDGANLDKVLLDFNREKDGSFTKTTPNLPVTNYSYDLFSVSGQGVGGMFRPFRGDLGYLFDSRNSTTSDSYSLGLEIATANLAHGGTDVTINDVNTTSGKWTENNNAAKNLVFRKKVTGNPTYEPAYFKEVGEKNVDANPGLYNAIGREVPVRVGLQDDGGYEISARNKFVVGTNADSEIDIPTQNYRTLRQKRNQLFSYISKKEYEKSAVYPDLEELISSSAGKDHIAEITTTKTDGTRYVYGIPAYNTKQREVTFNIGGGTNDGNGTVTYDPSNGDNTKGNENGIDNYFSSTELPPYAHSYLLTAVLSADYVDLTGNGPSKDDYGTYTKFSYKNVVAADPYKWRVPFSENKANLNEGLRTGDLDEQGNYLYGEKEIWNLEKIETKNYVAVFVTKKRADGFGVKGEDGGIGDEANYLLKKISLYSAPDYNANFLSGTAVPIKEVHFVYDYSLCPGTLNNVANNSPAPSWSRDEDCEMENQGGKLTLKKLFFTYASSHKGRLNAYTFNYAASNPAYGMKDYDKWGNYKPNFISGTGLSNSDYPYVEQDSTTAATYTSAWSLSQIGLPSGGTINVQYESDDYAFVQDRRAMQMFKITGIGSSSSSDPTTGNKLGGGDYLFFKLQQPVPNSTPKSVFYENYLKGIKDLYFRFLIKINKRGEDYVSGYGDGLADYGFAPGGSGTSTYGYIRLSDVTMDDSGPANKSPISKAAIQFARINTPRQAYNNSYNPDPDKVSIESVVKSLADAGFIKNIIATFQGANGHLYDNNGDGCGRDVSLNKSWIRLLNPNQKKLGGGVRVKKITISDNWGSMVSDATQTFAYGQEYDYTKMENGKLISSGVASYEPLVGGDENPFRTPIAFSQKFKLAADYNFFQEEPFGETFFPSASVGYSQVTVKSLQHANVERHATGHVVNEFYTARDYPVITNRTPVDPQPKKTGVVVKLLSMKLKDFMTASQGFSIELNDMHGKPKMTKVFAERQNEFISAVEYKYKSVGNKLDNTAMVINKDGSIQNSTVGIDYDFVADMREQRTDVVNAGLQVNLYGFLVAVVPVVIPPILPTYSSEETRFRSATVTKVINHFGLLEETIAYDLGSVVSTKNLAYDSETGEVVLTKTKNDFNDEIYSFDYPSHLAYNRMGPGYKNISTVLSQADGLVFASSGKITDPTNTLVPGDEIQITGTVPADTRFWISKSKINGDLYAIDKNGVPVPFTGDYSIKIIRSGRRNQQSFSVGKFTSLLNPIDKNNDQIYDTQLSPFDESYQILNASAVKYSEVWRTFCECGIDPEEYPGNPYLRGVLGNWRMKRSYAFLSDRNQTKLNNNSNIRKDGTFNFFRQFWSVNNSNDWTAPDDLTSPDPNWTWSSEVTEYSPYSPEIENRDALNRFSAAVFGYNNSLPTAVGSNTRYKQLANDNFEDYEFDDCPQDHFSFEPFVGSGGYIISTTEAHTGKRSIKIPAGGSVELTKTIIQCDGNTGNDSGVGEGNE